MAPAVRLHAAGRHFAAIAHGERPIVGSVLMLGVSRHWMVQRRSLQSFQKTRSARARGQKKGSPAAAEARPGQITRIHRGSQKKTRQAIKHQGWRAPQGRRISLRLQNLIQIEPPREVRRSPPPSHPIDFPHSASHTPTKTATPTERQAGQVGPGVAHLTHTRAACQASKSAGETMAGGHEKISPRAHWLGVAAGTGARGFGAWGRPGLDRRRGGHSRQ